MVDQGVVCSIDPLVSGIGREVLESGGNAADAAIAAGAALTVVAPHLCGLGGDLFALVHVPGQAVPTSLNASGRAGSGADPAGLRAEGHTAMPFRNDLRSSTVPGCVDGWFALHERHGSLPMPQLLAPAIALASSGWPATAMLAKAGANLAGVAGAEDLVGLEAGATVRRERTAAALRAIAEGGRDGFYLGDFGQGLIELGAGLFNEADLAASHANWEEPLSVEAFGHRVWSAGPNSQGYLLLLALAIADRLELPVDAGDPLWAHYLVEASRQAGYDRPERLFEGANVSDLLAAAGERAARISADRKAEVPVRQAAGGTTYMAVLDGNGMGVSYIQSNAAGFGTWLFEPRTGIGLQNRGTGFNLEPGHPAEFGPGKRPPHTLVPALVTRADGSLRLVAGSMGGDSQPQIVAQLIARVLHGGESVESAVGAARWRLHPGETGFGTWTGQYEIDVELEGGSPEAWAVGLGERGFAVRDAEAGSGFGHAHLIEVDEDGRAQGAADPRAETGTVALAPN
ncbi:gamma-glutamyltransferase family protein [Glycomyces algeriensis]|uniref:Gamma-glutamyltranspeptidase n=1 Tax=Glycomyces algeriensis TaxID=256037 RepID=A0A9W6LDV5_9ACTN|nr:gamma-glutamyltransferase [Glycomyces algeriensis]MDA1368095.1 gamma-glutamyltransferase [Glycomyces algeriensis]MDR7352607.1 gamma-glutamyltranspeptidase/glutathione hydrolase [Glycomyces algeriensis]GLI40287.1 gamma-glutamyltranspeptidase [Glycomyces algeriensis]